MLRSPAARCRVHAGQHTGPTRQRAGNSRVDPDVFVWRSRFHGRQPVRVRSRPRAPGRGRGHEEEVGCQVRRWPRRGYGYDDVAPSMARASRTRNLSRTESDDAPPCPRSPLPTSVQASGGIAKDLGHVGCTYERHRPEEGVLYRVLQAEWRTFLAEMESAADPPALPAFVVAEVEAFLRCGILAHGLILARCRDCGWSRAVAFSCQRRGFCPSCIGRRMCDFAARLVTSVLPRVPVRQWVLTVPHALRAKLAVDPALTTVVLREFIAAVSAWLRRRARRLGIRGALKTGAVTVIQRFNSALDVAPLFHTLFMDGIYTFRAADRPTFHPVPSPSDEEVAQVAAAVFRRVERKLAGSEPAAEQRTFAETAPLLVALAEASARGVIATGPRRGCRVLRVRGARADVDALVMGRLCAQVEGYNLQAATRIAANDREGLERMGRYLARPPVATDRLSQLEDGRLELRLKRPWRDGTTGLSIHAPRVDRALDRDRASTTGAPGPLPRRPGPRVRGEIEDRAVGVGRDGHAASARDASRRGGSAKGAEEIPVGIADLACVPGGCPRVYSLFGTHGDRSGRDVEGRGHANPRTHWPAHRRSGLPRRAPTAADRVAARRCSPVRGGSAGGGRLRHLTSNIPALQLVAAQASRGGRLALRSSGPCFPRREAGLSARWAASLRRALLSPSA
jgi:hypothetical protein